MVRLAVGACIAAALSHFGASTATAQLRDVTAYYVTVTSPDAALRCGPDLIWYGVAQLVRGQVLLVDGETEGWLRAGYPAGACAVVRTSEAQLRESDNSVLLTRRSRLRAYNPSDPVWEECWKAVFPDEPLRAGTELRYVGPMKGRAGNLEGYIVEAPSEARGYVLASHVRRATEDEVRQYLAATRSRQQQATTTRPSPTPSDKPTASTLHPSTEAQRKPTHAAETAPETLQPAPKPVAEPREEPVREESAPTQTPPRSQPVEPESEPVIETPPVQEAPAPATTVEQEPARPETQPDREASQTPSPASSSTTSSPRQAEHGDTAPEADPAQTEPSASDSPTTPGAETEAPIAPIAETKPAERPKPRPILNLNDLDAAYEDVSRQPLSDAEFEPLIVEFRRYLGTLGDGRLADRERRYVEAKIEGLQLQADLQRNEASLASLADSASHVAERLTVTERRLAESRDYDAVGRLMASAIYDGSRLPLLYRLQSVEGGTGRTIAYLTPTSEIALDSLLGSIVGVHGEGRTDEAAGVLIIRPARVEVLRPADTGGRQ